MTGKDELKRAVCEAIDRNGNEIIELGERILHRPETGFNEDKTAALIAERMRTLDLEPQTGLVLTGVKGRLKGKTSGPRLALIGELYSLRRSDHPLAEIIDFMYAHLQRRMIASYDLRDRDMPVGNGHTGARKRAVREVVHYGHASASRRPAIDIGCEGLPEQAICFRRIAGLDVAEREMPTQVAI